MANLSACYSALFDGLNAEVQIRWLQMVVRNTFYPDLPRVRTFLHKHVRTTTGAEYLSILLTCKESIHEAILHQKQANTSRMYTVPLYEDLVAGVMKCVAVEIFYQTQRRLHPNLRRTLQLILFPSSSAPANQSVPVPPILTGSAPSGSPLPSPAATATASAAGTTAAMALRDVNVSA
ncbi:hypothetical protein CCH79_00019765 [Gambusia affinis]|uniref:Peptidase M1 leukotriene A4 hydrolase/aminopeptidase C-terminal domain-containing protein n=1 Tax=Gambusia affinis TaxID=33528 RepID=A0A315VRK5_GAMAF|nr:hypothetical protein CCH79_00019765 [Gambusia affinis]